MSLTYSQAAQFGYSLTALSTRDSAFTVGQAAAWADEGIVDFALRKAEGFGLDVSPLRALFDSDEIAAADVNEAVARSTNSTEPSTYGLRDPEDGWAWIAAIWLEAITRNIRRQDVSLS